MTARRVNPGDPLKIKAAEYNRLLRAADAVAQSRFDGAAPRQDRLHLNASVLRVYNDSDVTIPIGGNVAMESVIPDPDTDVVKAARDTTLRVVVPNGESYRGKIAVAVEPIAPGRIGRVVVDGVAVAQVNVIESWHNMADLSGSVSDLRSAPDGTAQILWRRDPEQTGPQWAVVRIGNVHPSKYLAKVPSDGIPARVGSRTGQSQCELHHVNSDGDVVSVVDPSSNPITVSVRHYGTQPIRGSVGAETQYVGVTYDGRGSWLLEPPKQTLLCKPTKRIKAKSWGAARELRFGGTAWAPSGNIVSVYNVCDYALLTNQQIVCHFHEDTSSYLTIGCRCCDGSSSSSSSDSHSDSGSPSESSSSESDSSHSLSLSSSSEVSSSDSSQSTPSSSSEPSSHSTSDSSLSIDPSHSDSSKSGSESEPSESDSESGSDVGSHLGSESQSDSDQASDSDEPSDSESDYPSGSYRPSESERPSDSDGYSESYWTSDSNQNSDSNPPSDGSGSGSDDCHSVWVWSCGWELLNSDCDEVGEPPSESASYDGQVLEMAG
ncbi:hypothetical protein [Novipirellula artificiosorum]|uniref:Uncharacterized protein n=1 Tax=Novipirellula artificiosorum TaxID=2528016 RepID=A0A5C6DW83_9BACT|nr:hypothetical protein [Novipirellula artificiosorum]TWU39316.1 hypothetical protein Poly41_21400 [Novipirellula artificiosorum]